MRWTAKEDAKHALETERYRCPRDTKRTGCCAVENGMDAPKLTGAATFGRGLIAIAPLKDVYMELTAHTLRLADAACPPGRRGKQQYMRKANKGRDQSAQYGFVREVAG